jgi:hypothetical protein
MAAGLGSCCWRHSRAEVHEICYRIEAALKADMDGEALVTIHVEPEAKAETSGVPVLDAKTQKFATREKATSLSVNSIGTERASIILQPHRAD